ncbi:hypothetical protein [Cellulomonas sp. Y8]|uniref:hypothetical protein n=1 Tax=Cellulomonas sp. Y8 TaxID=2591145 RepID=UPI003D74F9B3
MRKVWAAVVTTAVMLAGGVALAQPAAAAGCTYSNLSSTRVLNKTCSLGAYAYRSGTTWVQNGSWAGKGAYSYNWSATCFANPGMIGIV